MSLNKAVDKLQDKNPRRAQQITQSGRRKFDLDNRIQKAEDGIKSIQQSLDAGYQEDQKLLLQLKGHDQMCCRHAPGASPRNPRPRSIVKKKN